MRLPSDVVELAYTETGSGEPLVLVMGINAPRGAWRPHTDAWSRSFRCIAVDNRGAGESPAPAGPYSSAEMADDYAALMRRLDIGPSRVVGISLGGAIAQQLALRHPDLVSRLVLVASWARASAYSADVLALIAAARQHLDEAEFTAYLQTLVWTPAWFSAHGHELRVGRGEPLAVDPAALVAQVAACASHDTLDALGAIRVSTLVTAGRTDRFIPWEDSRELAAAIPGARLETFETTGHVHHWEELDRFNALVEEWLLS